MKLKQHFPHRFFICALVCMLAFAPFQVSAAEITNDPLEAENQAAYQKTIESNSWENWPTGPSVYAQSAIVMEADSGVILYAKDIEAKQYPASITKIMTALVTLEHCQLDEEIEYSYQATHSIEFGSSSIARTEGEILTVEETLYGLMLASANECANALAEYVAGSVEDFAVLMNQKAEELGCVNTHFANANGLHDENHYTCAYDMALITRAALENEDFRRISGEDYYTLRSTNKNPEELLIQNHHYMISTYKTSKYLDETVFSGKTGYTTDALNTLVTCASRNGMDVIVVTMRTRSGAERGVPVFTDTAALLDYANNFQKINIADNEQTFIVGNAYDFSVKSDEYSSTASLISIDHDSCVILPNTVAFSDAAPSISFEESENGSLAYLSYEYAGQTVGRASITLEDIAKDEPYKDKEAATETNFIIINIKYILILIAVIFILSIIAFSFYRFYIRNRLKIKKAVQIYQKRKFLKRRHRRKRKRK